MTPDDVLAALRHLGDDGPAVAATLGRLGIKGQPSMCEACPIWKFLTLRFPGARFEVNTLRIQIAGEGRVNVPLPVGDFIDGFDHGQYPELFAPVGA